MTSLSGLSASWSFHDSWATNIAAGSGLAVLFLGTSDALTHALGPNSQGAVNVISIAGAASVALIGGAGVLVLAIKKASDSDTTVGGLLAGTAVALGAAAGESWAVALGLNEVNLGQPAEVLKWFAALASTALLVGYAITSIWGLLTQGALPDVTPEQPKASGDGPAPGPSPSPSPGDAAPEKNDAEQSAAGHTPPASLVVPASWSPEDLLAHAITVLDRSRAGKLSDDDAAAALEELRVAAGNRAKLRARSALP